MSSGSRSNNVNLFLNGLLFLVLSYFSQLYGAFLESYTTVKGQIVIPSKIRRKFRIKEGTRMQVVVDEQAHRIILTPITRDYIQNLSASNVSTRIGPLRGWREHSRRVIECPTRIALPRHSRRTANAISSPETRNSSRLRRKSVFAGFNEIAVDCRKNLHSVVEAAAFAFKPLKTLTILSWNESCLISRDRQVMKCS